jgi:hypothetical protein
LHCPEQHWEFALHVAPLDRHAAVHAEVLSVHDAVQVSVPPPNPRLTHVTDHAEVDAIPYRSSLIPACSDTRCLQLQYRPSRRPTRSSSFRGEQARFCEVDQVPSALTAGSSSPA